MPKYLLLAMNNAVEGRDVEFNDWYSNQHLKDVLKIPGIVSAQRYTLSPVQRMAPPFPWTYFAIYEVETSDLKATMDALSARVGTANMPMSDAIHEIRQSFILQAITDKIGPEDG